MKKSSYEMLVKYMSGGWPREGEVRRSIDDFFAFLEDHLRSPYYAYEGEYVDDIIAEVLEWLIRQGCEVSDVKYVSSVVPCYGLHVLPVFVRNKIELDPTELFYGAVGAYDNEPAPDYMEFLARASAAGIKWQSQECQKWAETEECYQFFLAAGCPMES